MNIVNENIDNCLDCKAHKVIPDPDPNDWFCDDDEAVLCTLTDGNPHHEDLSGYKSSRQNLHRCVTSSCRPYNTRRECDIPDWCPKLNKPKPDPRKVDGF